MDFHTLTRRELQALCKMNKIQANMTNVAMANALKALEFVEGIEEVMKPSESGIANSSVESPEKSDVMMSSAARTSRRTAIRTTAHKEPEFSETMTRARRSARRMPPEEQVKNDVIETPAAPTGRRRAATTSVRSKMESLLKECVDTEQDGEQILNEKKDVPKTPGTRLTSRRRQVKENTSVLQVYSTRRSARLASKYEEELSKEETEMSQTATFDSFTDETYEILDVNSKLCSLHLDDEQGKADSSAFSNGNENQNVESKELDADMHQNSEEHATEEITNGLIENYATVDFSAGKESNDVEVVQQGADLLVEGHEVVCDNMAGEVSECVVEKAGDEMVEDYSHFKGGQEEEDEDSIRDEISDHAVEDVDVGENTIQCKHLDDENKLHHHGNEISEWEAVNVDALNKGQKLAAADEMVVLLSKQLEEEEEDKDKGNNTNGISDCEVEDEDEDVKFQEVVVIGEQLGAASCNEELDTNENSECCEVDDLCKGGLGLVVVGNDGIILTKQLDEVVNAKEISNTDVEEDEEELDDDTKENSECGEVEDHGMVVLDDKEKSNTDDVEDAADLHCNMALSNQPPSSVNEDEEEEGHCMNDEISEQDASSDNMHEEKLVGPASKDLVDPNSTLMLLDPPAHIFVSDVAETDSDNTFQSSCLTTTMGLNHVTDDKENVDNSGMKLVLSTKEKLKKKGNAAEVKNQKPLEDLSLRKLTKMMKEMKIQIAEKSTKAAAVSRPALQHVPENCLVGESRNRSQD